MSKERLFPQILLLGNGLNRAYGGPNWSGILKEIHCNGKVPFEKTKTMPFPLQAVLSTGDAVDNAIKGKIEAFYGIDDIEELSGVLRKILGAGFSHILTTNYGYELERASGLCMMKNGKDLSRHQKHTSAVKRAEAKYLLHTFYEVSYNNVTNRVWHIHGEARKPGSIILGHYYYGSLLGKYLEELTKRKNDQERRQKQGKPIGIQSWLDAFIMGDVYTIGFGFDYSEIDLWWLLNRKKREKAEHGKFYYYSPTEDPLKESLMDTYGAVIENCGFRIKPKDYKGFYQVALEKILNDVTTDR